MVVHSIERRWRVERQCEEVIRSASLVRWSLWEHASLGVCVGDGVGVCMCMAQLFGACIQLALDCC